MVSMERTDKTAEQKQRRAEYLRGKIVRAQDELSALVQPSAAAHAAENTEQVLTLSSEQGGQFKDLNVLIAVPCFNGSIGWRSVVSLVELTRSLSSAGIRCQTQFVVDSLITRARNFLASVAAYHTDKGRGYTHIFFQDADVSFQPEDVQKMLAANKPICALPYALKTINWTRIAEAARNGIAAENLPEFGGFPNLNSDAPFAVNQPAGVRHAATGAMLIKVEVLKALADAHPERKYKPNLREFNPRLEWHHDFFRVGICPETKVYLSEDYQFCADAALLGFRTFVLPTARTLHTGTFDHILNMAAIASLGGKRAA